MQIVVSCIEQILTIPIDFGFDHYFGVEKIFSSIIPSYEKGHNGGQMDFPYSARLKIFGTLFLSLVLLTILFNNSWPRCPLHF